MKRPIHEITQGVDQLSISQQYAKLPREGLVVGVRQRTTQAGRSVLLTPEQVRLLRDDLAAWLDALERSPS